MTDLTLGITLKADGSGLVGEVKIGQAELDKLGKTGKRAGEEGSKGTDLMATSLNRLKGFVLGAIGAYAGFAGVQRLLGAVTREIMAAEKANANLNAVLRATGGVVGLTVDELSELADQLERTTLFDDAEIKQAEAVMLTFKSVTGSTFREAISLATDLAALMGGDLQGAVLQLGKALEDPETGLTALRRSGISFTESQRELIKSLVETGDRAQAMQIILDTVAGQIGGVASEQVTGLTGKLNQLDDAWGDLLKSFADSKAFDVAIAALETITRLIDRLNASGLDAISNQIADLQAERSEIFVRMRQRADDWLLGGASTLLGFGDEAARQRLDQIEAELASLQDAAAFLRAGQQLTPPPARPATRPVGGGGGSGEESDAAKQIRETIEALEFEEAQLGRTSEMQAVYNALNQAGVDIETDAGQRIRDLIISIADKQQVLDSLTEEEEAHNALMEEGRELTEALRTPTEVYADTIEHLKDLLAEGAIGQETFNRAIDLADKTLEEATDKTNEWAEGWKNVGAVSTEALADILLHAEDATEVLDALGQQILQILSQKLFSGPLDSFFGSLFEDLFPSAKGNVFSGGRFIPFARGGIVTRPTIFPMANGAGLMGEAGPEAVMPLGRDSSGRLGVRASGAGGDVEVNIYNQSGAQAKTQQRRGNDGRTIVDVFIGEFNRQIANGGPIAQTLQGTYGLSRRTR